jgi:hypothetical protein
MAARGVGGVRPGSAAQATEAIWAQRERERRAFAAPRRRIAPGGHARGYTATALRPRAPSVSAQPLVA